MGIMRAIKQMVPPDVMKEIISDMEKDGEIKKDSFMVKVLTGKHPD
jgi:hypothetical protein